MRYEGIKSVSLRGEETTLLIDLPFEVTSPPRDEVGGIPPELDGIILKAQRYRVGNDKIFLNASFSLFNPDVILNLSEEKLYEALNGELNLNVNQLKSNNKFTELQAEHQQTKIDGNPAVVAMITYIVEGNKKYKSTLVYTFKGNEMWRLIFDYPQDDAASASTVDSSVKSIKFK